ncbi:uncharacterized protein [Dysidea avara]|uniref:uncharacterized protein n=1 Tax=Dysidea avara TaxID=196820 RepID=UPI00332F83AF
MFQILQLPDLGRRLRLMVDSASPVTFINSATWNDLDQPPLTPTNRELNAFEGQQIKPLGCFQTLVKREDLPSQSAVMSIFVSHNGVNFIGRDGQKQPNIVIDPQQFGIVSSVSVPDKCLQDILDIHSELFKPGLGCCTTTTAKLILKEDAQPKYCKPRKLPFALKPIVGTELDRLEKEGVLEKVNHSEWATPIVVVKKPSGKRIVERVIQNVPGTANYLDDIIVTGSTEKEHLANLESTLAKLKEFGFHLRMDKCKFFQNEIEYLGHVIDKEGIHPQPAKIDAITNIPFPKNQAELCSFLGMDAQWCWTPQHSQAVKAIKQVLTSSTTLLHHDPELLLSIACDASQPSAQHVNADGLSRLPLNTDEISTDETVDLAIVCAVEQQHPRSNGEAERLVQTFKNAINKIDPHTNSEIQEALVDFLTKYRSTPHSATNQTPSEMLNNHQMRTILDLLHPCNSEAAKSQQRQKTDCDVHIQPNKFKVGDLVWARNFREGKRWLPENITQQNENVLYEVFIKDLNSTWRRHANQLHNRTEWIPESESVGVKYKKHHKRLYSLQHPLCIDLQESGNHDNLGHPATRKLNREELWYFCMHVCNYVILIV